MGTRGSLIDVGTQAMQTPDELIRTQVQQLTDAVTRAAARISVLEQQVRDLRSHAIRVGILLGEDVMP